MSDKVEKLVRDAVNKDDKVFKERLTEILKEKVDKRVKEVLTEE